MMKMLRDIADLKNKKVLLRVDFDVPVSERDEVQEKFRIEKQKPTLNFLVDSGAKVVMVAHISDSDVGSFGELIPQLHILLGHEIGFIKKIEDTKDRLDNYAGPALLENVRQFKGEIENSVEFAKSLSEGFDLYINNDFAVCHRDHASVSAITNFLPSYAGFLMEEEIANLKKGIESPAEGKIIIIGGAKASTKIPIIKNLIDSSEAILTGGVVANDILKACGVDVGNSIIDDNLHDIFTGTSLSDPKLIAPEDYNISENKILDIGPKTIDNYVKIIEKASMIIWNGPMGVFEKPGFEKGTQEIAKAVAGAKAYKIIGGGDTIAAVANIGLDKFDFVSTGGGAMLAFLAGDELPGLKALGYYK